MLALETAIAATKNSNMEMAHATQTNLHVPSLPIMASFSQSETCKPFARSLWQLRHTAGAEYSSPGVKQQ